MHGAQPLRLLVLQAHHGHYDVQQKYGFGRQFVCAWKWQPVPRHGVIASWVWLRVQASSLEGVSVHSVQVHSLHGGAPGCVHSMPGCRLDAIGQRNTWIQCLDSSLPAWTEPRRQQRDRLSPHTWGAVRGKGRRCIVDVWRCYNRKVLLGLLSQQTTQPTHLSALSHHPRAV